MCLMHRCNWAKVKWNWEWLRALENCRFNIWCVCVFISHIFCFVSFCCCLVVIFPFYLYVHLLRRSSRWILFVSQVIRKTLGVWNSVYFEHHQTADYSIVKWSILVMMIHTKCWLQLLADIVARASHTNYNKKHEMQYLKLHDYNPAPFSLGTSMWKRICY